MMLVFSIVFIIFLLLFRVNVAYTEQQAKKDFVTAGIELYFKEKGVYPKNLEEVVANGYINRLPEGVSLQYQATASGYFLD
jgi:competence protein ComGC